MTIRKRPLSDRYTWSRNSRRGAESKIPRRHEFDPLSAEILFSCIESENEAKLFKTVIVLRVFGLEDFYEENRLGTI